MPTLISSQLRGLDSTRLHARLAEAASILRAGELVVLPTETVYGVSCNAASAPAVQRLHAVVARDRSPRNPPSTWHAPSLPGLFETVSIAHPAHRRLLRRLAPGPVTFWIELPAPELQTVRRRLAAVPGAMEHPTILSVRVPDHDAARQVIERAGVPVIAEGISAAGWGVGDQAPDPRLLERAGVGCVLDEGPTRLGKPSSIVRLAHDGSFSVPFIGAVEERFIRKQVDRLVLFVCTGNTCRSPMAQAIAERWLADRQALRAITRVRSAGVSASAGAPATPEAIEALARLGAGFASPHAAAELSPTLAAEADLILTMTNRHREAALDVAPSLGSKIMTLDPSGRDIPDPIGAGQEAYDQTARRLMDLVSRRMQELDA